VKIGKYRENAESVGDAKWLTNLDEMVILFLKKKSKQEVTLPYCIFISQEQTSLCTKKRKKRIHKQKSKTDSIHEQSI
jgi:hypothetical protein